MLKDKLACLQNSHTGDPLATVPVLLVSFTMNYIINVHTICLAVLSPPPPPPLWLSFFHQKKSTARPPTHTTI